ncbi:hypothetical protein HMPREF0578_1858 [Mobiluncus mulieris 28-1]|nr:hypothetical protein HMPREF0578_1858 [Mobiluncus mulieris 28-1]
MVIPNTLNTVHSDFRYRNCSRITRTAILRQQESYPFRHARGASEILPNISLSQIPTLPGRSRNRSMIRTTFRARQIITHRTIPVKLLPSRHSGIIVIPPPANNRNMSFLRPGSSTHPARRRHRRSHQTGNQQTNHTSHGHQTPHNIDTPQTPNTAGNSLHYRTATRVTTRSLPPKQQPSKQNKNPSIFVSNTRPERGGLLFTVHHPRFPPPPAPAHEQRTTLKQATKQANPVTPTKNHL